ncbi:MAG: hypothetical protein CMH64_02530 [Nanoarchaeota archaeon]|nr:hypothetical protein [Nanoarchaeota archaeon]|tara:strand:- start:1084 stop:2424 length:1341 start_codon:yes stop_codon:yes gene_type:complete
MKKIFLLLFVSLVLIGINVEGRQLLGPDLVIESLTINPFPVEPDSTFDVTMKLRNSDTRKIIRDLRFNVQESYPFSIESNDKIKRIEVLSPNEQVFLNFKIKTDVNAIRGENKLKIEFQEGTGVKYISDPINVDVKGAAVDLSIASITTNPDVITPGSEVQIVLAIKNTVPVLMKNIDINFDLSATDSPFTPLKSTTKRSITSLNKGDSKGLEFELAVDADTEPKVYKIPLEIDYEDEFGNEYSIDTLTGLKISTDPLLQYSIDESEVYNAGNAGKVTIKIVNSGLADTKFLSLELEESNDYDIVSVPIVYVGNLESDDYETAEFDIYVKNSGKNVPLDFVVKYRDSFNEEYEVNEIINLPLYSQSQLSKFGISNGKKGGGFFYYVIIVIFIYLFVVEWKKTRNVPLALKLTVRHFLVFVRKVIKSIRLKTLKNAIVAIMKFIKEE